MNSTNQALFVGALFAASLTCFAAEQEIDLTSDNFNVFSHLADEYVKTHFKSLSHIKKNTFGMGYTSFDDNSYSKVGFIGYEFIENNKKKQTRKNCSFSKVIKGGR